MSVLLPLRRTNLVDVDMRVISATNRDLRDAIAKGQFREETLLPDQRHRDPPACPARAGRRRPASGPYVLRRFGQGRVTGMDAAAAEALERYGWPGNVREL
jgi:DNA-binding NtrC family response regulator